MLRQKIFEGSYYDIGLQRAKDLATLPIPIPSPEDVNFANECRRIVQAIYPPIIDEFEGILEAGSFQSEAFTAYFFARKEGILRGCTSFAALPPITADKTLIVGRNYDWIYSDLKWCELRYIRPDGANRTLSYTHHWAGSPDVLNEKGLCLTMASLPPREPQEPGLQWNIVVEIIMDTLGNVRDAIDFMQAVPHLRTMSYLLADSNGDAAVVEAIPGCVNVREPTNGYIIATNHRTGEDNKGGHRSRLRYGRVDQMLRRIRGTLDVHSAKEILRDHTCYICSGTHGDVVDASDKRGHGWGTIWSLICKPQSRQLWVAPGHPCEAEYQEVQGL